jgi:hypothetical protein
LYAKSYLKTNAPTVAECAAVWNNLDCEMIKVSPLLYHLESTDFSEQIWETKARQMKKTAKELAA